jgi:hypothetical protein
MMESKFGILIGLVAGFFMALCIVLMTGFTNHTGQRCSSFAIDDTFSEYYAVGYRNRNALDVSYESDTSAGDDTATTLTLLFCQAESTNSCQDYDFDTTADGLGNTNVLVGGGQIELAGVRGITGFNFLKIVQTGPDPSVAGATPFVTICRRAV